MRERLRPFAKMSFRRRLLLLILAVSLIQVFAAFATFSDTQSTPHRLRYEAQLDESVNKVLVTAAADQLAGYSDLVERISADETLRMLVSQDDADGIEARLASAAMDAGDAEVFVTDEAGAVVAGSRPRLPFVETDAVRMVGPAGEDRFIHVPAQITPELIERASKLTSSRLFAANDSVLVTADGVEALPEPFGSEPFQEYDLSGATHHILVKPADSARQNWMGAGVPSKLIAEPTRKGVTQLWLFFGALAVLAVLVAWIVTSAVDQALAVFARRARRVSDGYLDERIPVVGRDSAATAAGAFNAMAQSLKERIEGLRAAEARLQRQVQLFGDVLTSEDGVDTKLAAVCQVATETTFGDQVRFWVVGEAQFRLAANIDVAVGHNVLAHFEAAALRGKQTVSWSNESLAIVVSPAMRDEECLGLLTVCSTNNGFDERDIARVGRFAAQAAVAIENARLHEAMRSEHQLLSNSFSQYVPASVVEQLLIRGESVELGGAARDISVLFCDIRGFTSWSEQLAPTDVVAELNKLLSVLSDCVFETQGTLDKFTGDGLMAIWSAPLDQPDHADRACRTAALMIERMHQFNEAAGEEVFRIGIGVHSGPAVVGNIGHDLRHDYTAIGDTVNLSARIEAATKEHDAAILISQDTLDRLSLPARRSFERIGEITVKGRKAAVTVHRHVGEAVAVDLDAAA